MPIATIFYFAFAASQALCSVFKRAITTGIDLAVGSEFYFNYDFS